MTTMINKQNRLRTAVLIGGLLLALGLGLTACSDDDSSDDSSATVRQGTAVQAREVDAVGTILAGSNGMTLYVSDKDAPGVSNCGDGCTSTWTPLTLAADKAIEPAGLPGALTTIARPDGGRQLAYNDRPLYFHARDSRPGDVKGDGVGGVWHVVAP